MKSLLKKSVLAIIYITGIWKILRYLNRQKIAILMYHGVARSGTDIWTQVNEGMFRKQMRYINEYYEPISLRAAVDNIKTGRIDKPFNIAMTFDDGFKNNLTNALPILRDFQVPATIFLTTTFIDGYNKYQGLIWTDFILCLFLSAEVKSLDMSTEGLWDIDLEDKKKRISSKNKVCNHLKRVDAVERERVTDIIAEKLGHKIADLHKSLFLGLSWSDVSLLKDDDLISFGSHTVNHEILSRLNLERQEFEIAQSKIIIESKLNKPANLFAYPNGTRADFDDRIKLIASQNYYCGLSTIQGFNSFGEDLYELKRLNIGADLKFWEFKLLLAGAHTFLERFHGE